MGNAKRIAGRIAAWAWGADVFHTDSGNLGPDPHICEYCSSKMEHGYCSECLTQRYPQPPARQCPKCGGAIPEGGQCKSEECADPYQYGSDRSASANPALDALVWLMDDLTETHKDVGEPETLDEILQWRSVANADSVIKTMKAVKVAPDPDHFKRLKEQQWDRDRRRQHGSGDQPL